MPTVLLDSSLERRTISGFRFPLGVYPVEVVEPVSGFVADFEPADGGDDAGAPEEVPEEVAGDWEPWPDRYMFDVLITASRIPALCRALFSLLPPRVYPILDVLGADAYREIDPYIAYDLVGAERFLDGVIHFGDWLFEDGLVGFGAMAMNPFMYVFVDEHKAVTIRVAESLRDSIRGLLESFDLTEVPEIVGADAVAHEHRSALVRTRDRRDGLHPEEVVERLQDAWLLQLNIDTTSNTDDDGHELGVTPFRCVLRCHRSEDVHDAPVYAEMFLSASCHEAAEAMALDTAASAPPDETPFADARLVFADRLRPEEFNKRLEDAKTEPIPESTEEQRVYAVNWYAADR